MKSILVSFSLITVLLAQACGNGKASSGKEGVESASKTEENKATIHLNRDEFILKVVDYTKGTDELKYLGDKPCIVDFYANWCGPCRKAAPIMEELAKEYEGKIYIYKVNTQEEQQLATDLGIQSIPAFFFFPVDGKPFTTSGIASTPAETKKMFKEIIDKELLKIK